MKMADSDILVRLETLADVQERASLRPTQQGTIFVLGLLARFVFAGEWRGADGAGLIREDAQIAFAHAARGRWALALDCLRMPLENGADGAALVHRALLAAAVASADERGDIAAVLVARAAVLVREAGEK